LGDDQRDDERPSAAGPEGDTDCCVHEQAKAHRGEDRGLGLATGDVEVGRFEGGQEPHGEYRAEEYEGLGRTPPGEVMQQVLGQLRHGEHEDEVVEELER
jgi:hypothetical protein